LRLENERLKRLLDFTDKQAPTRLLISRVVAVGASPHSHTLRIAVGSDDGVAKGAAVIAPDGVVGTVAQLTASYADVQLIVSPLSAVAAISPRTRSRSTVKGTGDTSRRHRAARAARCRRALRAGGAALRGAGRAGVGGAVFVPPPLGASGLAPDRGSLPGAARRRDARSGALGGGRLFLRSDFRASSISLHFPGCPYIRRAAHRRQCFEDRGRRAVGGGGVWRLDGAFADRHGGVRIL